MYKVSESRGTSRNLSPTGKLRLTFLGCGNFIPHASNRLVRRDQQFHKVVGWIESFSSVCHRSQNQAVRLNALCTRPIEERFVERINVLHRFAFVQITQVNLSHRSGHFAGLMTF